MIILHFLLKQGGTSVSKTVNNVKVNSNKHEQPVVAFWNKHRKGILIATGIVGTVGTAVLTVLGVKYYWNATAFERWFKKAPLDELKTVRDNVHSEYMKHTVNDEFRESLWNLLPRLDKKIREIEGAGKISTGPAYHREHGYNLYKPD